MTSPDLIHELKASRPAAPAALSARVREIAAEGTGSEAVLLAELRPHRVSHRAPCRPAAHARDRERRECWASARSGGSTTRSATRGTLRRGDQPTALTRRLEQRRRRRMSSQRRDPRAVHGEDRLDAGDRAGHHSSRSAISATLTVEVANSDGVSRAAQKALDLTESLGGHVVSANVATGEQGNAALVVRVPVDKVQEAIVQLSALGRIVSQQVTIDDLQENLDRSSERERSVRAQIALVSARLESDTLDATTRARLESRLQTLRSELRQLRRDTAATNAEARMATIQLTVVTPGVLGAVPVPVAARPDAGRGAERPRLGGRVALAIAIVAAPFALLIFATWLGRRLYRRREEERLLAT